MKCYACKFFIQPEPAAWVGRCDLVLPIWVMADPLTVRLVRQDNYCDLGERRAVEAASASPGEPK